MLIYYMGVLVRQIVGGYDGEAGEDKDHAEGVSPFPLHGHWLLCLQLMNGDCCGRATSTHTDSATTCGRSL